MARKRDHRDVTQRENPYGQLPEDGELDGDLDPDAGDFDEYDDEPYEDDGEPAASRVRSGRGGASGGGFLRTGMGRALVIVIALLLVLIVALFVVRLVMGRRSGDGKLPAAQNTPVPEATGTPQSIVFGPAGTDAVQEPEAEPEWTAEPEKTAEPEPTGTPEPTATPLPIILTNTPTPSPTARPTATPTPSPTPSPTPTPTATPVADLGTGKTNRDANLRESTASNGKVKQTVKKGKTVTIHEAVLDTKGNVWYNVTVDDLAVDGWMRDYVLTLDQKIAAPTATPKAASGTAGAAPTPTLEAGVVGTGKTLKRANLRDVMNGKVIATLSLGRKVFIYGASVDKNGDLWYELRAENGQKRGFMRDYLVKLDEGVELELPEGAKTTAAPDATAAPKDVTAETTATPDPDSLLEREVIGRAVTNREANVRVKPASSGKLVRQLSKGVELMILAKYEDDAGAIWYEVTTTTGKTYGFVRDYVVNVLKLDKNAETLTYPDEG